MIEIFSLHKIITCMIAIFFWLEFSGGNDVSFQWDIEEVNQENSSKSSVTINNNWNKEYPNCNTSLNESYDFVNGTLDLEQHLQSIRDYIFQLKAWTWVLIALHTFVFTAGVVGNILVCVAVFRNHCMKTVTNYFIVNLAVADFLVILFCLPLSVVWDVYQTWFFGVAMCKIVLYLQTVSVTVSVLTLAFISLDRWYAICFPLQFKSTTGRAKTAIGIIWILALVCGIPDAIYSTTIVPQEMQVETIYFTQCGPTWSDRTDTIFLLIKMIFLYFLPLLFMSLAYLQIIKVLWRSGNIPHPVGGSNGVGVRHKNCFTLNMNTNIEGQLRSRRKAAKMLVVVVAMFAICYFPVYILSVLRATIGLTNSELNKAFSLLSKWLCYANSAVNPIIYNFMSGKFRKEFRRAFERCCQKSNHRQCTGPYRRTTEKDSMVVPSRTQSRTDMEMQKINNCSEYKQKHTRKGTKTSLLNY